jgi:hypothetical protein
VAYILPVMIEAVELGGCPQRGLLPVLVEAVGPRRSPLLRLILSAIFVCIVLHKKNTAQFQCAVILLEILYIFYINYKRRQLNSL